jgi:colicin import membrane protein
MAKESETIKERTEDQRKRIAKTADAELRASETDSKLETKISDKYAASIQAAIRPNITFDPGSIFGDPAVEIQVGLKPDGSIMNAYIVKTSGVRSWDVAALSALAKTERLPIDENGRVPPTLLITMRPRER